MNNTNIPLFYEFLWGLSCIPTFFLLDYIHRVFWKALEVLKVLKITTLQRIDLLHLQVKMGETSILLGPVNRSGTARSTGSNTIGVFPFFCLMTKKGPSFKTKWFLRFWRLFKNRRCIKSRRKEQGLVITYGPKQRCLYNVIWVVKINF
jgi:hypothetical protein